MLTIQIEDPQLEQRILETAAAIGKTAQEFLKDLVERETKISKKEKLPFDVPRRNPALYAKVIDFGIEDEDLSKENVALFSHIDDAADYVHNLRKQPRN